jgi:hypothetical protein
MHIRDKLMTLEQEYINNIYAVKGNHHAFICYMKDLSQFYNLCERYFEDDNIQLEQISPQIFGTGFFTFINNKLAIAVWQKSSCFTELFLLVKTYQSHF